MNNIQLGFVKRAMEHGFSYEQALEKVSVATDIMQHLASLDLPTVLRYLGDTAMIGAGSAATTLGAIKLQNPEFRLRDMSFKNVRPNLEHIMQESRNIDARAAQAARAAQTAKVLPKVLPKL